MKKQQILIIAFLILLSICAFASIQSKAQDVAVSITVSPATASITAGTPENYTATATDACCNSWDVTDSVTWSISSGAGGSWNNNTYTSATAGSWTVTADNGAGVNGTASLTVTPGALAQFVFSAISSPQTAGTSFSVTITAVDSYGNTVTSYSGTPILTYSAGSITPSSATGGFADGIWTGMVTVTTAGSDVTLGVDDGSCQTGTSNPFTVSPAAAVSVAVSPGSATITAGNSETYTATATDAYGNTWDVTSLTTWSISSGAGGSWSGNVYNSYTAGSWTVAALVSGVIGTASLTINPGALASFSFGPANYPIGSQTAGTPFTLTITAYDAYGNVETNYAGPAVLSDLSGSLSPTTATFTTGVYTGSVTITTAYSNDYINVTDLPSGIYATSNPFTVSHAATASSLTIAPADASITAGTTETYSATATDAYGNTWNVTSLTTWSISNGAGGSWSNNIYTSATAGSWTVNGTYETMTATAQLTVNTVTYQITVTQSAHGTIVPGTTTVDFGATPSFAITPDAGYYIASITANGASVTVTTPSGQSYQFSPVSADGSLTATFAINTYTITVTQGANGVIAPGTTTVDYGGSQTFTITPNTGYYIASLTVDGSPVTVASSYTFSNVEASHTISATFAATSTTSTAATPTPTPKATTTPTPKTTTTPSSSSTATPSPTPSPTPLYLVLFAIIIATIILLISAIAIKRQRRKLDGTSPNPENNPPKINVLVANERQEIASLKGTIEKIKGLEAEKKSLLLEIKELKKMADAKATT